MGDGEMGMKAGSGRAVRGLGRYGAMLMVFNALCLRRLAAALGFVLLPLIAHAAPLKIMAFGDSLFAGYGLSSDADNIPNQIAKILKADGRDVTMINAAVSGDTTADGLARLDWSLQDKPDLVLLELGANDALRGLDPDRAKANLDGILARLKTAGVPVLICGMIAPRNLGPAYSAKFDPMFKELADKYRAPLYPFILDGVALNQALNQADGMHPNKDGAAIVAKRLTPAVEKALPPPKS